MKFLFWTLAFVFAALLMEGTVYVFHLSGTTILDENKYPDRYIPYSHLIWTFEGYGERTVNRYGFLDRDYDIKHDVGIKRGLLFGTSISEALQVFDSDVYDNILEDSLSGGAQKFEIFNFGRSLSYLADQIAAYQSVADSFPHSFVILQINPDYIYTPLASSYHNSVNMNHVLALARQRSPLPKPLYDINQFGKRHLLVWNAGIVHLNRVEMAVETEGFTEFFSGKRTGPASAEADEPPVPDSCTSQFTQVLKICTAIAAKHNAKVFLFPFPLAASSCVDSAIKSCCDAAGIAYLDIRPGIETAEKTHCVQGFLNMQLGTGHLNSYGHKVLASILYQKLHSCLKP